MTLDHTFVEQILQQLVYALIGWLISLSVRALRRRILGPSAAAAGNPEPVVVRVEVSVHRDHVLLAVTVKDAASTALPANARPGRRHAAYLAPAQQVMRCRIEDCLVPTPPAR